jgi:hypothetical protein
LTYSSIKDGYPPGAAASKDRNYPRNRRDNNQFTHFAAIIHHRKPVHLRIDLRKTAMFKETLITALVLASLLAGQDARPQEAEPRITQLSVIDRDFMDDQRQAVDERARSALGRQIRGDKSNDLDVLQQLLDRQRVKPDETVLLQGMGVVMGDLLAEELGMDWVIYEDKLGRSRALRFGLGDHFLYPVTMISRRYEVGAPVDVRAIYDKAVELMRPHLPPRPFQ